MPKAPDFRTNVSLNDTEVKRNTLARFWSKRGNDESSPVHPFRDKGGNSFLCYENGTIKPQLAMVQLLKVLDRHPELLEEVKVA